MQEWAFDLLLCSAVLLLALACFQSERSWIRRAGLWLIFGGIGLGVWLWTGNITMVIAAVAAWFVVPVGQAVYLSRKLRFSSQRQLNPGRIEPSEFEDLAGLTSELRNLDFVQEADYWLEPSPVEQGYRLFVHRDESVYAAISIIRQGGISLYYTMFLTPDSSGNIWMTWDYPLAYGLKMPPGFKIYRCLEARSSAELLSQHHEFLNINQARQPDRDSVREAGCFFDEIFKSTLRYNLSIGLLRNTESGKGDVVYTWRGTFFISWQVLVELVTG